jgi:hypothetical protein
MTTATSKAMEEGQIRKLMDDRVKAVRTRDVNASMSHVAPDILSFDVVNPLQHIGSDASRKRAEEWFSSFEGPIGYEIHDLSITAGVTWPSPTASAMLARRGQTEDNSICGGARPFASARLTGSGRSRMNITPCLLT